MKRIMILICMIMMLTGCSVSNHNPEAESKANGQTAEINREDDLTTERNALVISNFYSEVCWANYREDPRIVQNALNVELIQQNDKMSLPLYLFDTIEDVYAFKNLFADVFEMDYPRNEVKSFNEVIAKYNDDYFERNSLLLCYVTASSSSYSFAAKEIICDKKVLCIKVYQTNDPEWANEEMAGWFIIAELDDETVSNYDVFDAQLDNEK